MAAAVLVALALAVAIGGGLLLSLLVRAEHGKRETSSEEPEVPRTVRPALRAVSRDRRDAERAARRDTDDRWRQPLTWNGRGSLSEDCCSIQQERPWWPLSVPPA